MIAFFGTLLKFCSLSKYFNDPTLVLVLQANTKALWLCGGTFSGSPRLREAELW